MGVRAGKPERVIETAPPDREDAPLVERFVDLSLEVDDIKASHQTLVSKGVSFTSPPTRQPWDSWLARFKDPAGSILTLLGRHDRGPPLTRHPAQF